MRKTINIDVGDVELFKQKLVRYSTNVKYAAMYDSNGYYQTINSGVKYHSYDFICGFDSISVVSGNLQDLEQKRSELNDWLFGYLSYDLKNDLEQLYSVNADELNFQKLLFFQPRFVFAQIDTKWELSYYNEKDTEKTALELVQAIQDVTCSEGLDKEKIRFSAKVSREKYIQSIQSILEHIHKGDVYELNYCMEFFAKQCLIDPYTVYNGLTKISPTPFAAFVKSDTKYVMSASPERYLKKEGSKLICQPIKGTASRGNDKKEDEHLKDALRSSVKEQSENIMITDLVRNDLSRVASRGSVKVEELCGIYPFRQVFQMITTVVAELGGKYSGMDAIKTSFPMGSMTGAPKIRAMKLIEKYEETKRGVYSGAVGYFSPEGDFDFNVVIRSLLYNVTNSYLSFMVGSAITEKSIPNNEYDECILKAKAIFNLFNQNGLESDS
ncbi:anthranilate synthase component I family protein [Labilibacter sediminis]|nr:anthranilate synthase component I family protein [Labilibacter sediminis]